MQNFLPNAHILCAAASRGRVGGLRDVYDWQWSYLHVLALLDNLLGVDECVGEANNGLVKIAVYRYFCRCFFYCQSKRNYTNFFIRAKDGSMMTQKF